MVDAAVSLQRRGHSVVMHTAHHDASRCFEETRDGTLAVRVAGDWLPRTVLGRLHIVCATLRALYGALVLLATEPECDVVVVDQVSAPVPLLRLGGLFRAGNKGQFFAFCFAHIASNHILHQRPIVVTVVM